MKDKVVDLSMYRKPVEENVYNDFQQTDELGYAIQDLIRRLRDSEPLPQAS